MITISIVIITYNDENYIEKFINSLIEAINDNSIIKEIIFIDNNSTDNTYKSILSSTKDCGTKVIAIKNDDNTGFSRAVNKGVFLSSSRYVLLLNPDSILNKDSIKNINECLKKSKSQIIGGRLVNIEDNHSEKSYYGKITMMNGLFEFTSLKKIIPKRLNLFSNKFWNPNRNEIYGVSGGFMMFEKRLFKDIGNFDKNFFLYLEDIDFCLRAKKQGYKIDFCQSSYVSHIGGGSSKKVNPKYKIHEQAWLNSRKYLFKKHLPILKFTILNGFFNIENIILKSPIKKLVANLKTY